MEFSYQGFERVKKLYTKFFGLLCILLFTVFGIFIWSGIAHVPASEFSPNLMDDPRVPMVCFGIWMIAVSWMIGANLINLLPTVWVRDEGLTVEAFLVMKIHIPWSDVMEVREGVTPFNYALVRARRITFFHRFIGWLYSRTLSPAFLIGPGIEDRKFLIREIRTRMRGENKKRLF